MALQVTPRLKLPFLSPHQAQKEATVNGCMVLLDSMLSAATPQWGLIAPPSSPSNGDFYVIPNGATGDWEGKDGQLTFYVEGWVYHNSPKGLRVLDLATMTEYVNANSGWQAHASGGGSSLTVREVGTSGAAATSLEFEADFNVANVAGVATVALKGAPFASIENAPSDDGLIFYDAINTELQTVPGFTWDGSDLTLPDTFRYKVAYTFTGTAAVGAAHTISIASGERQLITLGGDTVFTLPNPPSGYSYSVTLKLIQDSTGGRVPTFQQSNVTAARWVGGSAPTWQTAVGAYDLVVLTHDGTDLTAAHVGGVN